MTKLTFFLHTRSTYTISISSNQCLVIIVDGSFSPSGIFLTFFMSNLPYVILILIKKMYFRLFKHAMALAPRSPDVLNSYGEFLEESRKVGRAFRLRVKYNRHRLEMLRLVSKLFECILLINTIATDPIRSLSWGSVLDFTGIIYICIYDISLL